MLPLRRKRLVRYLLDQEVEVLGKLGGEACYSKNLSVSLILDQAEA
jgi:hypothetical protein